MFVFWGWEQFVGHGVEVGDADGAVARRFDFDFPRQMKIEGGLTGA